MSHRWQRMVRCVRIAGNFCKKETDVMESSWGAWAIRFVGIQGMCRGDRSQKVVCFLGHIVCENWISSWIDVKIIIHPRGYF